MNTKYIKSQLNNLHERLTNAGYNRPLVEVSFTKPVNLDAKAAEDLTGELFGMPLDFELEEYELEYDSSFLSYGIQVEDHIWFIDEEPDAYLWVVVPVTLPNLNIKKL